MLIVIYLIFIKIMLKRNKIFEFNGVLENNENNVKNAIAYKIQALKDVYKTAMKKMHMLCILLNQYIIKMYS